MQYVLPERINITQTSSKAKDFQELHLPLLEDTF